MKADVEFKKAATSTDEETILVRVKPFNHKRGNRARTYSVFGYRFMEERGWYRVSKVMLWGEGKNRKSVDIGEYLKEIRNNPEDDQSPYVFDVCTQAEADAINLAEKKKAEKAAEPNNPVTDLVESSSGSGDLTSADVRGARESRAARSETTDDESGDHDLAPAPAPKRRGRPPGSKNAPKATTTVAE